MLIRPKSNPSTGRQPLLQSGQAVEEGYSGRGFKQARARRMKPKKGQPVKSREPPAGEKPKKGACQF